MKTPVNEIKFHVHTLSYVCASLNVGDGEELMEGVRKI